eukprot:CAMPEP_0172675506 /NCGR_PEP_ID=MMETSP1074-20121228/13295_1 /TAXON_ID=2916 /ORGANISM="Ceratium fusus, Strain PA161109" /LENGTH=437 /DNA_ID=CAMNT_0013492961 /DNA_START=18 /DNA_END=1329 /DNA_ORIENTATION=+
MTRAVVEGGQRNANESLLPGSCHDGVDISIPLSTIRKLDDEFEKRQAERGEQNGHASNLKGYLDMLQQILDDDAIEQNAAEILSNSGAVEVRHGKLMEWLNVRCGIEVTDEASEITRSKPFERKGLSQAPGRPSLLQASGHANGLHKDTSNPGFILKTYDAVEARNYETIHKVDSGDPIQSFVGTYGGVVTLDETGAASPDQAPKKFLRIGNLLVGKENPCVMDCKLGTRTFKESEVTSKKQRTDLYANMLKLDPGQLTDEERNLGAITKHRFMSTRDAMSSSSTLGFRIGGICSQEGQRADKTKELQKLREASDIVPMLLRVLPSHICNDPQVSVRRRLARTKDIIRQLEELSAALQESPFFSSHECIGTSVLFVVDKETAHVHLIDFAKTEPLPDGIQIDHRSVWTPGNHEDGVLTGVESLLTLWNQALAVLQDE